MMLDYQNNTATWKDKNNATSMVIMQTYAKKHSFSRQLLATVFHSSKKEL